MPDYFPLLIGYLGSLHCVGMCGPLVLAYSLCSPCAVSTERTRLGFSRREIPGHVLFNLGRVLTYGFLGTIAAGLFRAADVHRVFIELRIPMHAVGGVLLILLALMMLQVVPIPRALSTLPAGGRLIRFIQRLYKSGSLADRFLLGLAVGALPCCLSWAMIVTAAATLNPLEGFFTMVWFGAGTVPALLTVGMCSSFLSHRVRLWGEKLAAGAVLCVGVVYVLTGVGVLG